MKKTIIYLSVILLSSCSGSYSYDNLDKFSWMIGHWEKQQEGIRYVEEWKKAGEKNYDGISLGLTPEGDTSFQQVIKLQIIENIPYLQAENPNHKGSTLFKLKSLDEKTAVFEASESTFPTRYTYSLEKANMMSVKIDGTVDGKPRVEGITYEKL